MQNESAPAGSQWLGRVVAEVRRRRVARVLGAYLIASWGIIEVSSTVFPLLRFPSQAASIVVVLLLIGLPIVAVLAWTFDLTSQGIRRTGSDATHALPLRFGRTTALAVVFLALLFGGSASLMKRNVAKQVDQKVVAVLPFDVAAGSELDYLSEGIVDLLATKLSGEGGVRTVSPRTAIKAWQGSAASAESELDEVDALHVARKLGAGQYLLGNVVGTPARLSIAAMLFNSVTGAERLRVEVAGPADSLLSLVDRLAAELLSRSAGEQFERLAHLTTTSLPALKLYLEGRSAYRNGDFSSAQKSLERALALDSTFALAGLTHALVSRWHSDNRRGFDVAWANRGKLPARDLAILNAISAGVNDNGIPAELAAWEAAAAAAPDDPEAVFELGDMSFHWGAALGHVDAQLRALAAMQRSLELDPTFIVALSHMFQFDTVRSDERLFRIYAKRYLETGRRNEDETVVLTNRWLIALTLGDSAMLQNVRATLAAPPVGIGGTMVAFGIAAGVPLDDVESVLAAEARVAVSATARAEALMAQANHAALVGRPVTAARLASEARRSGAPPDLTLRAQIRYAISYDGDTITAAQAARDLARSLDRIPLMTGSQRRSQCELADWELLRGDTASAARRTETLRSAPVTTEAGVEPRIIATCASWLEVRLAHLRRQPNAAGLLARLDSLLVEGAFGWTDLPRGNITAMQLHEQRGEYEAALAAARRQVVGFGITPDLPTQLLGQARLAARVGHRDEAMRAYQRYLTIRSNPEPGTRAANVVNAARLELGNLSSNPR